MGLHASFVLYAMIGAGVAGSVYVRGDAPGKGRWFGIISAAMFWPLYVPLLLSGPTSSQSMECPDSVILIDETGPDELTIAIDRAEAELDAAVGSLDGWAEQTLACEADRFAELKQAWRMQASRIRELTQLLEQCASDRTDQPSDGHPESESADRHSESEAARLANLQRLRDVRERIYAELLETLAWVRELVTMIHLARYTGAPASRATDLVTQIAAAVEGLSEVSELQSDETVAVGSVVS